VQVDRVTATNASESVASDSPCPFGRGRVDGGLSGNGSVLLLAGADLLGLGRGQDLPFVVQ